MRINGGVCVGNSETMTEKERKTIIEQLWLTYFNDTLFAEGAITEEMRNKIRIKIHSRTARILKKENGGL